MKTCIHLSSLESDLEARGILGHHPEPSPYGDSMRWYFARCTFDEPSLRRRLAIPASVEYAEYDGRVAGSDATWFCRQCQCVIMGLHPRYAPGGTPRIR